MNILDYTHKWLTNKLDNSSHNFNVSKDTVSKVVHSSLVTLLAGVMRKANNTEDFKDLNKRIGHDAVANNLDKSFNALLDDNSNAKHIQNSGGNISHFLLGDKHDEFVDNISKKNSITNSQAHILNNISAHGLFAVLKRYLSSYSSQHQNAHLAKILSLQTNYIQPHINDETTSLLGWGTAAALFAGFSDKFKKLFVDFGGNIADWAKDITGDFTKAFSNLGELSTQGINAIKHGTDKVAETSASWLKWLWLIPLFLLLAWLFKYCSNKNATTDLSNASAISEVSTLATSEVISTVAPAIAMQKPSMNVQVDAKNMVSVQAKVANEEEKQALLKHIQQVFGDNVKTDIQVVENTEKASWLNDLTKWLPQVKLANSQLSIQDNTIRLEGASADPKLGLADKIKAVVAGAGMDVSAAVFNADKTSENANQSANQALAALKDNECKQDDLLKALNLQSINFASSSHNVPKATQDLLKTNIGKIKACSGKFKLKIDGHTDSQGKANANLELSKKRSDSIAKFLVTLGIKQADLIAEGFGDTKPVADNTTAEGRFKNRRIEFNAQ
jgi:outer membrane protein OmpA-like peptidoglycan-associated protein